MNSMIALRKLVGVVRLLLGLGFSFGLLRAATIEEMRGPGLAGPAELLLPVPRTLDLSHVTPEAFAAALGKDENRIFAFVRDQIAYEPYAGCLRGPRGALLARAGNSIDRAALLAALMNAAGKHVRFVHGNLGEKEAAELVKSTWEERSARTRHADSTPEWLRKAFQVFRLARDRDFHLATEQLKKAPLVRSDLTVTTIADLTKIAATHYWIQYEKEGSWLNMDPSFATSVPGQTYASSGEAIAELPENLFHRITLRLVVDELSAGTGESKLAPREVLRYTSRAADLAAVDLVLMHRGPGKKKAGGLTDALESAGKDNGRLKPALLAPSGKWITGGDFETKSPKTNPAGLGSMRDMLGGGSRKAAAARAVAERLEFEFAAPDGSKETVVRDVFDLVGVARRSSPRDLANFSASAQPVTEDL